MPIKLAVPFTTLVRPTLVRAGDTHVFICQYTCESTDVCVGLPTTLVAENSESPAQIGCFRDFGCVLGWMRDNRRDIERHSDDGKEQYRDLEEWVSMRLGLRGDEHLDDYTAPPREQLTRFGGPMSFEEFTGSYAKPSYSGGLHVIELLERRAAGHSKKRNDGPTITTAVNAVVGSAPQVIHSLEVVAWPAMKIFAVRPVEPSPATTFQPFMDKTGLTVEQMPARTGHGPWEVFAPEAFTKHQAATLRKLGGKGADGKPVKRKGSGGSASNKKRRPLDKLKEKYAKSVSQVPAIMEEYYQQLENELSSPPV